MASSPELPRKAPKTAAEVTKDTAGKLAGAKENFENEVSIAEGSYKLGEKGLSQKEKKNMTPAERAKYPKLEKGKKYIAVGGVDKTPFKQTMHDNVWYYEMAQVADLMLKNKDSITFEFPTMRKDPKYKERILAAVHDIANGAVMGVTGDIKPEDFKQMIEKGRSLDDVYGAEGAFNVILAYGRAIDKLNNVEPGASIEYRLKLSGKRYSQLLGKKEKAAAKPKVVPGQEGGPEKPVALGRVEFISTMNRFLKDRVRLMGQIEVCVANKSMSEDDATKYRKLLLEDLNLGDPEQSPPSDRDLLRLKKAQDAIEAVQSAVQKAEASIVKPEPPRELPYDVARAREAARQVVNEGNLEKNYNWKSDTEKDIQDMASLISRDVVSAVNPIAVPANEVIPALQRYLSPLVIGMLNLRKKERMSGNDTSPTFRLSEDEKTNLVSALLDHMSKVNPKIKRNTSH